MTDDATPNPQAPEIEHAHDPEVLQLAGKVFDLARHGDTDTLAAYVDAGVPANLTNDKGDSLVMLAAYHGHPAAVRALLERGGDPDRANDKGQTPLAGAVFKGEDDVVRALVEHGADPTAGTPSAIDTARMFEKTELLKLFGAGPAE
ncbi:ankyrin repeat domain-containing protein [Streptomyces sp. H27-D2]|uniref:ankyrin repeat domain-containing protein n=1 Tax=Streptomyces sp. H27-D2 TaxID=3046304 RepID=UPI002DBFFC0E|nr:ankyrin repeat domain-containing protein [Streptomyces sp. H27-D2]MEC4015688.1 ankyrin repeat domain-containing protein [Streptomyces sp. H27-D2]